MYVFFLFFFFGRSARRRVRYSARAKNWFLNQRSMRVPGTICLDASVAAWDAGLVFGKTLNKCVTSVWTAKSTFLCGTFNKLVSTSSINSRPCESTFFTMLIFHWLCKLEDIIQLGA